MTNAEILLELDEIMQQAQGWGLPQPMLDRLAAIRLAISRKPGVCVKKFASFGVADAIRAQRSTWPNK